MATSTKTASKIDELADAIQSWVRRQLAPLADRQAEAEARAERLELQVSALLRRLDATEAAVRAIRREARDGD
jgi:predicted  nucleic acid-binding Zn-ribbon protein